MEEVEGRRNVSLVVRALHWVNGVVCVSEGGSRVCGSRVLSVTRRGFEYWLCRVIGVPCRSQTGSDDEGRGSTVNSHKDKEPPQ